MLQLGLQPTSLFWAMSTLMPALACADSAIPADQQIELRGAVQASVAEQAPTNVTLEAAEFNYRARRLSAAMEQFGMVAAMEDHPFAWLRVGNICHRRGDASGALDAYQRAANAAAKSPEFAALGHRAVMNQALLGLDQAQSALETLGMNSPGGGDAKWIEEMQLRLQELSAAIPATKAQNAP